MRYLLFLVIFLISGCGDTIVEAPAPAPTATEPNPTAKPQVPTPGPTPGPTPPAPGPAPGTDGKSLFTAKCASCHGGQNPNIKGVSAAQIKSALNRVPAMRNVKASDSEINLVVGFLGSSSQGSGNSDADDDDYDDDDDD